MSQETDYGIHTVRALMQSHPDRISCIWVNSASAPRMDDILDAAAEHDIPVLIKKSQDFEKIAPQAVHQSIVALVKEGATEYYESDIKGLLQQTGTQLVLALDGIQDPHNLGALIRSANAFGVGMVLVLKNRAASITPVVQKVSSGAASITPIVTVINLVRALEILKEQGFWVTGLDGEADQTIAQVDLTGPQVLVLGAEGEGLRRLTRERCDYLASIPMQGTVSSLNVSVAGGVALYEVLRQRSI